MRTRLPRCVPALLLLLVSTTAWSQISFDSLTIIFGETWSANAYRQPYVDVTGSEAAPINAAVGTGARITFARFGPGFAVTFDPRFLVSVRRYLLYPNGWVVPTQTETALGATEDPNVAGIGSARVISLGLVLPVGLEVGLGERVGLGLALSPSTVYRVLAGDVEVATDASELNGMYAFFYGNLRWLRPEVQLALRVDISDYLGFTVRANSSVSVMDLTNPTFPELPWWDQLQVGGRIELNLSPPFSGLFRTEDDRDAGAAADPANDGP